MFSPMHSSVEEISSTSTPNSRRLNLLQELQIIADEPLILDYQSGSLEPIISNLTRRTRRILAALRQIPEFFSPEITRLLSERLKIYRGMIDELSQYNAYRDRQFKNSDQSALEAEKQQLTSREHIARQNLAACTRELNEKREAQAKELQKLNQSFEEELDRLQLQYRETIFHAEEELPKLEKDFSRDLQVFNQTLQNCSAQFAQPLQIALNTRHAQYQCDQDELQKIIRDAREELSTFEHMLKNSWVESAQNLNYSTQLEIESLEAEKTHIQINLFQINMRLGKIRELLNEAGLKKQKFDKERFSPDVTQFLAAQAEKIKINSDEFKKQLEILQPAPSNPVFTPPRPLLFPRSPNTAPRGSANRGLLVLAPATPKSASSGNTAHISHSSYMSVARRVYPKSPYVAGLPPKDKSEASASVSAKSIQNSHKRSWQASQGNNLNQAYRIIKIPGDGNCGYTGIGINRAEACELLTANSMNLRVLGFLEPVIQEVMDNHTDNYAFQNYLVDQGVDFYDSIGVAQAFLLWDIHITDNWVHPGMLQALAYIQNFGLRIWRFELQADGTNRLVPHRTAEYDYSHYMPENPTHVIDLIFVNNNHFNIVEISPEYLAEFYPAGEQGRLKVRNIAEELEAAAVENPAEKSESVTTPTQLLSDEQDPSLGSLPLQTPGSFGRSPLRLIAGKLTLAQRFAKILYSTNNKVLDIVETLNNGEKIDEDALRAFAKEQIEELEELANEKELQHDKHQGTRQDIRELKESIELQIAQQQTITIEVLTQFLEKTVQQSTKVGFDKK